MSDIAAVIARVRNEIEDGLPCESSATLEAMIGHIDAQAARIADLEEEARLATTRLYFLGDVRLKHEARIAEFYARIAALEGALAFWRQDAISRLETACDLHQAYSDDTRRSRLRVGTIMPTLAAIRDADAGHYGDPVEYSTPEQARRVVETACKIVDWDSHALLPAKEPSHD